MSDDVSWPLTSGTTDNPLTDGTVDPVSTDAVAEPEMRTGPLKAVVTFVAWSAAATIQR
jgi:hypothetical protein